jgi:octopine/nopaline transport system substrate-binding protein
MSKASNHFSAVALATLLTVAAGGAAAKDWSSVRIATEGAYPPWNQTDTSGQLVGFEIDLARDLCQRMGVECEIVAQDWEGIIPALQAGKYDAIMAAMSITDERKQVIQFSEPYADTPAAFAVLKDSDLAEHPAAGGRIDLDQLDAAGEAALADLKQALAGKIVGVQVATTHQNFIDQYMADAVDLRRYDTQDNLDLDLQSGRLDAALADLSYWRPVMDSERGDNLTLIGPAMVGGPYGEGIGVGIRQEDEDLVTLFNQAIAAAKADGTIAKLSQQWFGFDASA